MVIKKKGKMEILENWINPEGTIKTIYISKLDKYGYQIIYNTTEDWVVYTPLKNIYFRRELGYCEGMPYVELSSKGSEVTIAQTVRKKF